jgi:hypothetical protein
MRHIVKQDCLRGSTEETFVPDLHAALLLQTEIECANDKRCAWGFLESIIAWSGCRYRQRINCKREEMLAPRSNS